MTILDQIALSHGRFQPRTPEEFFGLCLAHKLNDLKAAAHYAMLASEMSAHALIVTLARARHHRGTGESLARRFHKELDRAPNGSIEYPGKLLALRIERRCISAAFFVDTRLDFTEARELSSLPVKAAASTVGFLSWLTQTFAIDSVAMEVEPTSEIRRAELFAIAKTFFHEHGISIWEISKEEMLPTFAVPTPVSRPQLREIVRSIWPILGPRQTGIIDAAALGLYVQTQRLLHN